MLETQSNRAGSHNFPGMAHHLEICPDSCSRASTDYPLIHDFIVATYLQRRPGDVHHPADLAHGMLLLLVEPEQRLRAALHPDPDGRAAGPGTAGSIGGVPSVRTAAQPGSFCGGYLPVETIAVSLPPLAARVPRPAQTRFDLLLIAAKGEAPAGKPLHIVIPSKGPAHLACGGPGLEAYSCADAGRARPGSVVESTGIRMHGQHIIRVRRQWGSGLESSGRRVKSGRCARNISD